MAGIKFFSKLLVIICFISCNSKESNYEVVKDFHSNGRLHQIRTINSKGEIFGKAYIFTYDGEKYFEAEYKNGLKHGKSFSFYKGSEVISEETFFKGKLNGKAKYYEENFLIEGNYKDDKEFGIWNSYNNDTLVLSRFFHSSKLVDTIYKDTIFYKDSKNFPKSLKLEFERTGKIGSVLN